MRFLHVIGSLGPAVGGPAEGIKQLAAQMPALGHTVEVVTLNDAHAPWLQDFPAKVHALGEANNSYCYSVHLLPWLRAHAHQYDAVIVNGLWQYHSFAVWRTLRKSKVPYFVFTHGMLAPWFKRTYPLKHLKKWLYWPWVEYRVLRNAQAVLFTCEEERQMARQSFWLYRCKEAVVGYGTSVPQDDPAPHKARFLAQFPSLQGKRLFLFLSRIHPVKGCDLLIEAFAKVAKQDDSLHLVMAGPAHASLQKKLMAQAAQLGITEKITWTGMLSGDIKWGAYHTAEVFVLPSHQENFGIVVVEALACGIPVLTSNKVNIWREIQADGAALVAEDSIAGTTSLLQNWLALPDSDKQCMRQAAVRCFNRHFEARTAARNLAEVLLHHRTSGLTQRQ